MDKGTKGLFQVGRNGRLLEGTVTRTAAEGQFLRINEDWVKRDELTLIEAFGAEKVEKAPKPPKGGTPSSGTDTPPPAGKAI